MPLKSGDTKKLWARSGNVCSFPGCMIELASEMKANRVIGEEAHIKGEKPAAPRYDPNQSDDERESYENRILLCPTHHTQIDADPENWSVERLRNIKATHEAQVSKNWQYPEFIGDLKQLFQKYQVTDEPTEFSVSEVIESAGVITVRVNASQEGGTSTKVRVRAGQRIAFFARGLITYDGGQVFTNPDGITCNEYGLPFLVQDADGNHNFTMRVHENAYKTADAEESRVGSLIGWIGEYTERESFLVGCKREIQAATDGELFLMVNDAKGTYGDNDGEFRVDLRLLNP